VIGPLRHRWSRRRWDRLPQAEKDWRVAVPMLIGGLSHRADETCGPCNALDDYLGDLMGTGSPADVIAEAEALREHLWADDDTDFAYYRDDEWHVQFAARIDRLQTRYYAAVAR
jgi:hypothetical protein